MLGLAEFAEFSQNSVFRMSKKTISFISSRVHNTGRTIILRSIRVPRNQRNTTPFNIENMDIRA